MSGTEQTQRDLSGGETRALQLLLIEQHDSAYFVQYVRRVKGKAVDDKILVVGRFRVYVLNPGGKLAHDGHYLALESVTSELEGAAVLKFKDWLIDVRSPRVNEIVNYINHAVCSLFPSLPNPHPWRPTFNVQPPSRMLVPSIEAGPCNGYAHSVEAMQNYLGLPIREDITWDINNLFSVKGIKEFDIAEFENVGNFAPLLRPLCFNTWFKVFRVDNERITNELPGIIEILTYNTTLTELSLVNISINKSMWSDVFAALQRNGHDTLAVLNVSNNEIDDNGFTALAEYIQASDHGLVTLDVSGCSGKKKGVKALCTAFKKNNNLPNTLLNLRLDGNDLSDATQPLSAFLATPNVLRVLSLAGTAPQFNTLFGALQRGCIGSLLDLDISNNRIEQRDVNAIATYIQSSEVLMALNLSAVRLAPEAVPTIVEAIGANLVIERFVLNISGNELGTRGATHLAQTLPGAKNIHSINVADNNLEDEGVALLAAGLCVSTTLRELCLDRNFAKKPTKFRNRAMNALAQLIESGCPLQSLSVAGSSKNCLKEDVSAVIEALGGNSTLTKLDVSGNEMGDHGAYLLGKALQLNESLRHLVWDNNETTLVGFQAFKTGLARNSSLKQMPIPLNDINQASKNNTGKTAAIIDEITGYLIRNQNPKKFDSGAVGGTAQVLNTARRQELQVLMARVTAHASGELDASVQKAFEDARNYENVTSSMQVIVERFAQGSETAVKAAVKESSAALLAQLTKEGEDLAAALVTNATSAVGSMEKADVERLNRTLGYSAKSIDEDTLDKLSAGLAREVIEQAGRAYADMSQVVSAFAYEKIVSVLEDAAEDLMDKAAERRAQAEANATVSGSASAQSSAASTPAATPDVPRASTGLASSGSSTSGKEPLAPEPATPTKGGAAGGGGAAGSPAVAATPEAGKEPDSASGSGKKPVKAPKPAPPPKAKKPTGKEAVEPGEITVDSVSKNEAPLVQLTKDRVQRTDRRPPTRRPRAERSTGGGD